MGKLKNLNLNMPSADDLFEDVAGKDLLNLEKSIPIPINQITNFPKHPFKVIDDENMERLVKSIKEYGLIHPAIVRRTEDGKYELISGHRRKRALELAHITEMPCIIKDLTDDEATILMVDSNIQREVVLPSERAYAYKMKLDAEKHQGKTTCGLDVHKSRDNVTDEMSGRQVQRYIRLTELIPELLQKVDDGKISLNPAVEISYLTDEEQYILCDCIEQYDATPSQPQAIRLKALSREGKLTAEKIEDILGEEKANQKPKYNINYERFEKILPRDVVTQQEVEDFLYKCVEEHNTRVKQRALAR